jgi:hypothetical protein
VHGELLDQENYRAADRSWYLTEKEHARSGATDMPPPARTVTFAQGILVLAPVENQPKHLRPKMVDATDNFNRPLASQKWYNDAESKKRDALVAQQKKLEELIQKHRELSDLLKPPDGKGLLQRIEDEKVKVKNVDEELAIVQPLRINTAVENELILRRDKMLRARIEELKASLGVASGAW